MAGRRSDSERDEMLDKVMGAGFYSDEDGGFGSRPMEPDTEVPSHLTLEIDEDGAPTLARFTYVDEDTCIGCKNCAFVARSTFFMEESFAGKARVFQQGGDDPDLVDEAIDSCPVSCIHHVSHEDLVTLERERLAREDNLDFNNYASFKRGWTGQEVAVPETQAQYYGSLAMGTRCNNCPSRGCASCPMFGVGKNPVYLQRLASREEKKVASGEAQREQDDRDAAERINTIYAEFQSVFGAVRQPVSTPRAVGPCGTAPLLACDRSPPLCASPRSPPLLRRTSTSPTRASRQRLRRWTRQATARSAPRRCARTSPRCTARLSTRRRLTP